MTTRRMEFPTEEELRLYKPNYAELAKSGAALIGCIAVAITAFTLAPRGRGFWNNLIGAVLMIGGSFVAFGGVVLAFMFLKDLWGVVEYKLNPIGYAQRKYIAEQKRIQEEERKKALLRSKQYWSSMGGFDFEEQFCAVLQGHGIKAMPTRKTADGGVDVWVDSRHGKVAIQCKAYKKQASPAPIRELYGVVQATKSQFGVMVCTGGFTSGAKEFGRKHGIKLVGIDDIVEIAEGSSPILQSLR